VRWLTFSLRGGRSRKGGGNLQAQLAGRPLEARVRAHGLPSRNMLRRTKEPRRLQRGAEFGLRRSLRIDLLRREAQSPKAPSREGIPEAHRQGRPQPKPANLRTREHQVCQPDNHHQVSVSRAERSVRDWVKTSPHTLDTGPALNRYSKCELRHRCLRFHSEGNGCATYVL
jgi:hypothetical protein